MTLNLKRLLYRFASVKYTLVFMALAMILVLIGTLAQVQLGTYEAQKKYFDSWWVFTGVGQWDIPVFPGGLTIGLAWLLNLIVSFITRFRPVRKDMGIFISHAGLILLLLGQFLTQLLAKESQMPLRVGETGHYSQDFRSMELVLVDTSDPKQDQITSVSDKRLMRGGEIQPPGLPFSIVVHRFYRNAELSMKGEGGERIATQGIGPNISVQARLPVSTDEESNNVTAFIEIKEGSKSRGIWLVAAGLGAPQSATVNGVTYELYIRPQRYYYPFTLTLRKFTHELYPGTNIPKNFASLVHLSHPAKNESRETLIYMNNPLRYEGKTFYQASFGENDTLSVLQVVDNPAAITPYLSVILVSLGLLIQFLFHLMAFVRKSA